MKKEQVNSMPKTEAEKAQWPGPDEICPVCNEKFGWMKKIRIIDGNVNSDRTINKIVIHKRCGVSVSRKKAEQELGTKKLSSYYDYVDEKAYWFNSDTGEIYIP